MVAGGFTAERAALAGAAACGGIVLLFASLTPLIEPSPLSIGSLFSYLGAIAMVVAFAIASIRGLVKLKAKLGGASSPAQSAQ
jgi:NADH:ubiquinone oxidoreductase subunit 6 (subunit J)